MILSEYFSPGLDHFSLALVDESCSPFAHCVGESSGSKVRCMEIRDRRGHTGAPADCDGSDGMQVPSVNLVFLTFSFGSVLFEL